MKVSIGPYINRWDTSDEERAWIEFRHKKSEYDVDEADYDWLDRAVIGALDLWQHVLNKTVNLIQDRRQRRIKVRIDNTDLWSLDTTLAYVIHPALVKMKEVKHGAPFVRNEDVPPHLHSPDDHKGYEVDEHWFERWDYVLDEMIFAFAQINSDSHWDQGRDAAVVAEARIRNGLRLFGSYYQALWD